MGDYSRIEDSETLVLWEHRLRLFAQLQLSPDNPFRGEIDARAAEAIGELIALRPLPTGNSPESRST